MKNLQNPIIELVWNYVLKFKSKTKMTADEKDLLEEKFKGKLNINIMLAF
jgi:hypothetical protein